MLFHLYLESLKYGNSYTIGSSKKRVQVNAYEGMLGKSHFGMVVMADNCYPVADKIYGSEETGRDKSHSLEYLAIVSQYDLSI